MKSRNEKQCDYVIFLKRKNKQNNKKKKKKHKKRDKEMCGIGGFY